MKKHLVVALMWLYPAAWRNEYGSELTDILLTHPLGARALGDVLWNGMRERFRTPEPSMVAGLTMLLVMLSGLAWNIAAPSPFGWTALLQPSQKTLPTVVLRPLGSELYVLVLVACGCWTRLRHGGKLSESGKAAMRVSFLAGIPVMLAGVLMLLGVLSVVTLGPGDPVTTFHQHGFAYTYFNAQHRPPRSLSVLLSPLFALPQSWIWGLVGGKLGQWISHLRGVRNGPHPPESAA